MEFLTKESFKEKIFDFEKGEEWKFIGERPCIIDFFADWCGPCKAVAPVLEKLSQEYKGKIDIFKINTEEQQELASMFGIRSIPSILFVPMNDKPQMSTGALPREAFIDAIDNVLLKD